MGEVRWDAKLFARGEIHKNINGTDLFICPTRTRGYSFNLTETVPNDWAVPMYGTVMPFLVVFSSTTNLFILIVLMQKHLRTPTNMILSAMTSSDLATGWFSIPWFLYYYTLGGYEVDAKVGMGAFWCHGFSYFYEIIPSMFHTFTLMLTVYLAIQRYLYVCVPNAVHNYCTPQKTRFCIWMLFLFSFMISAPEMASRYRIQVHVNNRTHCIVCHSEWVSEFFGMNLFYSSMSWTRAALHLAPCALLLVFTTKLARTINQAELRKRSWATEGMYDRRGSVGTKCSMMGGTRSMYATNRMLAAICCVFLLIEIPAGIINVARIILVLYGGYDEFVDGINRHMLIVLSSPIQFIIYCSMSEQFRLTARQLFTSRVLYIASANISFHGGKRYSLILVDVETYEKQKVSDTARKSLRHRNSHRINSTVDRSASVVAAPVGEGPSDSLSLPPPRPKRKVGRQVSFPDEDTRGRERVAPSLTRGHHSLKSGRPTGARAFRRLDPPLIEVTAVFEIPAAIRDDYIYVENESSSDESATMV